MTIIEEKLSKMNFDENYYACIANELILAKQSMSLWVARILNMLVMQLVAEDNEFKTYKTKITDLAKFVGINTGNIYEDVRNACIEVMQTTARIGTNNPKMPWKIIHWLKLAEYDGCGNVTLCLSDEVKPYLLDLKVKGFFTQYQIKEILPMNSYYAIRLYQYIKLVDKKARESRDYVEMTISEAREYFECENKYQNVGNFKDKVIETAVRQINENCNSEYFLEVEYKKTGRTVTNIKFTLRSGEIARQIAAHKK